MLHSLSTVEGAGKAGCVERTRSLMRKMKKAHELRHHRFAATTGLPCAIGFNGCFVLSPETGLNCLRG